MWHAGSLAAAAAWELYVVAWESLLQHANTSLLHVESSSLITDQTWAPYIERMES